MYFSFLSVSKRRQRKRKTVESESESAPQETSQETSRKASKKQKTLAVPARRSLRVARQSSDLTSATANLRISSGSRSSYDVKDLPTNASSFNKEDIDALNVIFKPFKPASEEDNDEDDFLPNVKGKNYDNYLLSEPLLIVI